MYPKNAASPERIAVGAVVAIADGTVQTSGVSISVLPQGGASGAGGGTTSYENGVVCYLPTQAETNYSSFVVVAYKTGCIPSSVTIVTSASATAGYAGVDWGKVTNATSTVNLSATTVKTLTDAPSDSSGTTTLLSRLSAGRATNLDNLDAAITTRMATFTLPTNFSALAITVGGAVTAGTVSDKTGYSLTSGTGLGNQTANITGNLSGSVGSVTGLTASDIAAIKAKTDSLTFTVAGQVDSNMQYVNDVQVQAAGTAGNEWRPV